ncbi:hypothetical protein VP1G_04464 [Cytospora mali]|uniref:Anaphase-promoting complex, subunit CDC26 n=1 Tax=Cytospora mali TaxID=578113 RepID=A0A194UZQ1_CYTMA|nr:hypothetical protein VP1G_04464 [Valsa mali var. pyri (nom. inval.)]
MLRRPPTVLTLTTEDVKAYEDRSEATAFKRETAAAAALHHHHHHRQRQRQHHPHQQQHQLTRDVSGMDITGMTTSSSEEDDLDDDNSEAEVSYYPNAFGRGYQNQGQDHIDGPTSPTQRGALHRGGGIPHGEEIYLNEEGSYDDTDSDEDGGFVEDEDMVDEPAGQEQDAPGGAAEMDLDAAVAAAAAAANTTFDGANSNDNQHPEPPPAPARITRATRTTSGEPSVPHQEQQQHQQQQQQQQLLQQQQQQEAAPPLPPPHTTRYTRTQATRRAPSGRARGTAAGAGVEATTPTPIAQAQRDAADRARAVRAAQAQAQAQAQVQAQGRGGSAMVTPDARVTRSRDERIGVPRGGRR